MNIFHITIPHSEGVVSRLINFCSPFAECIGEVSLWNKMVVIDFRVFPVAPIATKITFKSLSSSLLYHPILLILLPPLPSSHYITLWPIFGPCPPSCQGFQTTDFYEVKLSSACPVPNLEHQGVIRCLACHSKPAQHRWPWQQLCHHRHSSHVH